MNHLHQFASICIIVELFTFLRLLYSISSFIGLFTDTYIYMAHTETTTGSENAAPDEMRGDGQSNTSVTTTGQAQSQKQQNKDKKNEDEHKEKENEVDTSFLYCFEDRFFEASNLNSFQPVIHFDVLAILLL